MSRTKVEDEHDKEWILETYLNQVYFGNHAYGVEAAAQTYFSKTASDLDIVEAALLAGLPQAPSAWDPFKRPEEAVRRRNDVLKAMYSAGYINAADYEASVAAPLKLNAGQLYTKIREPYFFSFVREQLIAKYGANTVRGGGLKVYDHRPAPAAVGCQRDEGHPQPQVGPGVGARLHQPEERRHTRDDGRDSRQENLQFNIAAQGRRQAGSAFKTFALTEAIRQGINPNSTMYLSAPFRWQPDPSCARRSIPTASGTSRRTATATRARRRSHGRP